jgi:hypothetical protein
VSKFVDAVTTSALDDTFSRAVAMRRMARQAKRETLAIAAPAARAA